MLEKYVFSNAILCCLSLVLGFLVGSFFGSEGRDPFKGFDQKALLSRPSNDLLAESREMSTDAYRGEDLSRKTGGVSAGGLRPEASLSGVELGDYVVSDESLLSRIERPFKNFGAEIASPEDVLSHPEREVMRIGTFTASPGDLRYHPERKPMDFGVSE